MWCVCEAWVSSGCITDLHFHVIGNNFHTANALLQHSFFPTFPRFSFWDNCFLLIGLSNVRSSHWRCSVIQGVLRNFAKFTGKRLRQSLIFNKVAGWCLELIKEETLAQVFSCEFCKISKNTLYYRTPPDNCFCNVYEVQRKDVDTKIVLHCSNNNFRLVLLIPNAWKVSTFGVFRVGIFPHSNWIRTRNTDTFHIVSKIDLIPASTIAMMLWKRCLHTRSICI